MSSSVKLWMRYEDVPFLSDTNPEIFREQSFCHEWSRRDSDSRSKKTNVLLSEGVN